MSPRLSDPAVIEALDELYEAARRQVERAQRQLDEADAWMRVVNNLHDLAHERTLWSVS